MFVQTKNKRIIRKTNKGRFFYEKKMIATLLTGAMALSMVAGAATVMADDTTEAKDKYTIGFSPYTLSNEYLRCTCWCTEGL